MTSHQLHLGDNLAVLKTLPSGSANLIYIDPPFNTGRAQERTQIRTVRDAQGDRVGFKGQTYRTIAVGTRSYQDSFDDYLGFLEPRLVEAYRVLADDGAFFFHIDYREVHYCKVLLDQIFGRDSFINEIVWAYDYGARSKSRWPSKHDNILFYAKDPDRFTFDLEACDRIAYMAPELVGADKAERGKTPTDVWWHTIVSPTGREKTGYPTQKPLGIIRRLIKVHTRPGDTVLDFFGGSGTTGVAAAQLGRRFILCDQNPEAIAVAKMRLGEWAVEQHGCEHIQAIDANGYRAPADAELVAADAAARAQTGTGTGTGARRSPRPRMRTRFHDLLATVMRERAITTADLARATKVSFPTAQKIMGGTRPGRPGTIQAFAEFLAITVVELTAFMGQESRPLAAEAGQQSVHSTADGSAPATVAPPEVDAPADPAPATTPSMSGTQLRLF